MKNYTLYMSLRSPFARRVRILLEELSIPYDTRVVNVFEPTPELLEVNPLGRVPALVLPTGEVMVESSEIQNYFAERYGNHALFQRHGASEAKTRNICGLASGIMDHVVVAYLESLRPAGLQIAEVRADALEAIERTMKVLNELFVGPFMLGERVGVWDLDVGAALAYMDLRLGKDHVDRYPRLRALLGRLNERQSFKVSVPPT